MVEQQMSQAPGTGPGNKVIVTTLLASLAVRGQMAAHTRAMRALAAVFDAADAQWRLSANRRLQALRSVAFRSHGPGGLLADAWPTGRVVWLVIAALGSILIYSYL